MSLLEVQVIRLALCAQGYSAEVGDEFVVIGCLVCHRFMVVVMIGWVVRGDRMVGAG